MTTSPPTKPPYGDRTQNDSPVLPGGVGNDSISYRRN